MSLPIPLFKFVSSNSFQVLLPMSVFLTASGPLDNLMAFDVNGTVSPISLKLSPAIVRLMLHAVKTLVITVSLVQITTTVLD